MQGPEGEVYRFVPETKVVPLAAHRDRPIRLSHVVLNAKDVDAAERVATEKLGFRVSDRTRHMTFLRCNDVHHCVASARAGYTSLNPVAFEMADADAVINNVFGYFVGPDRAEVFTRKLDKLIDRQLAHIPPAPFDARRWKPRAFTRGWMFYRGADRTADPRCESLAPTHLRGRWVTRTEANDLPGGRYANMLADIDARWAANPPTGMRRWPSAQLIAQLELVRGELREVERVFVVPDNWQCG